MKTASLLFLLSLILIHSIDVGAQSRQPAKSRPSQRAGLNSTASSAEAPAGRATQRLAGRDARGNSTSDLPIRRVILYSNGVAYIERRGLVRNHAEVSLSFKQSQVDDVLKSMVVIDLGKGRIGAVSYNSSEPASSRLSEIPFSISAATQGNNGGGLAGVLSQLQGARVVVTTASRTVTGSVLTVEAQQSQIDATRPPVTTHRLVIASDGGSLAAFDLSDVRSVQLADEGSRRDLSEFAHAAASARRRDAKTIIVTSDGNGERELMVSYTIAAPIWKTTYRVMLDNSGKPFFQGWAIVDNVSDEDWNGIELSLVSGTPVSFIQQIQNPVYRYRPVIPMKDDLNLRPQTYEPGEEGVSAAGSISGTVTDPAGAVVSGASITFTNADDEDVDVTTNSSGFFEASLPPGVYNMKVSSRGFKDLVVNGFNIKAGSRVTYNARLDVGNVSETVTVNESESINSRSIAGFYTLQPGTAGEAIRSRESLSNLVANHDSGVRAETSANDIGDLFEYHIDQPVTVPRDRSALIPILQTRMEGERVSIYRGSADDDENKPSSRPMGGMLLKNTSKLTLEDGSLTVIDGDSYAGEALLQRLKPAEERLVSFALDLGTLINAHDAGEERQPTFLVRAVNGVVEAHYYHTRKKIYTLVNQTDKPRVVYIEHPRDEEDDWELIAGGKQFLSPSASKVAADSDSDADSDADTDADTDADNDDGAGAANAGENTSHQFLTRTAKYYRFRVPLKPHEKLEFPVVERNEKLDSYQLTQFTRRDLEFFIARKYIDEKTRSELEVIIALKDKVANSEARLQTINKETAEINQDQQRLRENIKTLTSTAEAKQLVTRYVVKADQQETRLDQLEQERRATVEERARLQLELESAIRRLTLDRRLD